MALQPLTKKRNPELIVKNGRTRRLTAIQSAPEMARYVIETCAILRMLRQADTTLTYGEFVEMLGLRQRGERWRPRYIGDASFILDLTAEIINQTGDLTLEEKDFRRIVNAKTQSNNAQKEIKTWH